MIVAKAALFFTMTSYMVDAQGADTANDDFTQVIGTGLGYAQIELKIDGIEGDYFCELEDSQVCSE
jgi:hypothetical protein